MKHRIKATRKRSVLVGETCLHLWDAENFDDYLPWLKAVPGLEAAMHSRPAALEYCRALAREIASKRPDHTACADDVTRALALLGADVPIGKTASAIFRTDEWVYSGRLLHSRRVGNGGRLILVWRLTPRAQRNIFEPAHFFLT